MPGGKVQRREVMCGTARVQRSHHEEQSGPCVLRHQVEAMGCAAPCPLQGSKVRISRPLNVTSVMVEGGKASVKGGLLVPMDSV